MMDESFGVPMAGSLGSSIAPPAPSGLDSKAKAAIVVRLLLNEGAEIPLEDLPDDLQARLAQQMGNMGLVDRSTVEAVAEEFAEMLDGIGLSFPHGLAQAISALDGKISPQTAARLRREAGVRQAGDPWARLKTVEIDDLAAIAQSESVEVSAVLLSKLDTGKAAELLGKLPGPLARQITYAISQTTAVTPEAVDLIGLSLAGQLDLKSAPAFTDGADERVSAILNQSAAKVREELLNGLDETDAEFAGQVRKSMFTFAHIPNRVAARDVPGVIRNADPDLLLTALAGATSPDNAAVAEYLLSNISTRVAENLREEIGEKGTVKAKDAEAAMTEIVNAIRMMEQNNEIILVMDDDEEEEE